jgi:cyclopropane-fatty-acyl-phospholipid synthase
MPTRAQRLVTELFARADIRLNGNRPWDPTIHDDRFYRRVLADGTLGLGEAYMDGWWDCPALDEMCCRAVRVGLDERTPRDLGALLTVLAAILGNRQSLARARHVGKVHYDLGNEFFGAMLGPERQYSCAWFEGTDDLAEAQQRKLELICCKLELRPGMRLLDIGCGWGGLARYAAAQHGCNVVGITISREQQVFAAEHCRGLPVEIRLQDYREVDEPFDRVVSVGMMEHVGFKNYRLYLQELPPLPAGGRPLPRRGRAVPLPHHRWQRVAPRHRPLDRPPYLPQLHAALARAGRARRRGRVRARGRP